jgi:hypothetical protein
MFGLKLLQGLGSGVIENLKKTSDNPSHRNSGNYEGVPGKADKGIGYRSL